MANLEERQAKNDERPERNGHFRFLERGEESKVRNCRIFHFENGGWCAIDIKWFRIFFDFARIFLVRHSSKLGYFYISITFFLALSRGPKLRDTPSEMDINY